MNPAAKTISEMLAVALVPVPSALAQDAANLQEREAAYTRTITQRADKIVATLGLENTAKGTRVRDIIIQQYRSLRAIHDARDAQIKFAKQQTGEGKETADAQVKAAQDAAQAKLDKLHTEYLARLSAELSLEQVEKVKDGLTYGVVQVTYNAYLKLLPDLTDAQKRQIMAWLVEAREFAMDEGTSDEKHKVFGKYKGKINNYLSAAGYNLKEAEKNLRTSNPPASGAQAK